MEHSTTDDALSECDTCTLYSEPSETKSEDFGKLFTTSAETSGQSYAETSGQSYVMMYGQHHSRAETSSMHENSCMCDIEEECNDSTMFQGRGDSIAQEQSDHMTFEDENEIELDPTPHEDQSNSFDDDEFPMDRAQISTKTFNSSNTGYVEPTCDYPDSGFSATSYPKLY